MTDERKADPNPLEDEHPLASPTELAGSLDGAMDAEFAARGRKRALEAVESDEAQDAPIPPDAPDAP